MQVTIAVCLGFLLDAIFGDPHGLWHPICAIGSLITHTERFLRSVCPKTPQGERLAGILLWGIVCSVATIVPAILLWGASKLSTFLEFALQTLFCYQIFARRSLRDESDKVRVFLENHDLPGARTAVSYIVGRNTQELDMAGVTRAAVETVAENTSDGVIAPMVCLIFGGAPLGFFYKAVNTLDSMVGYKNEKYLYLGWFAAKMDDLCNYIPARFSALCMIASAWMVGLDSAHASRIWIRDRHNHASPNSAQTESVCAGALHVQLAGNAIYFGKTYEKPTIGDPDRGIQPEDIRRTNQLMLAASILALLWLTVIKIVVHVWI